MWINPLKFTLLKKRNSQNQTMRNVILVTAHSKKYCCDCAKLAQAEMDYRKELLRFEIEL